MRACAIAFLAPLVLSCGDPSAPPAGPAEVRVAFASAGTSIEAGEPLVLEGNNGTLRVDSVLLLIGRVRLEAGGRACDDPDAGCAGIGEGRLVRLPLAFEPEAAGTATLGDRAPLTAVLFEVRTLREIETASATAAAAIRAARPAWPDTATALVTGTFRRDFGPPIRFRTYLRASFDARADLVPAATPVDGLTLVIAADPIGWFSRPKGEVLELSYFDHASTGRVLGFTAVMRDGFVSRAFVVPPPAHPAS